MMFQPESSFADTLFAELSTWEQSRASIASSHILFPRGAVFAQVSEDVQRTLPGGIGQLYTHQALVLEHALQGEHMTLATPTASGKTLALALSGHMRRTVRPEATTMCIAPTRALVEQWTE